MFGPLYEGAVQKRDDAQVDILAHLGTNMVNILYSKGAVQKGHTDTRSQCCGAGAFLLELRQFL